MGGRSCAAVVAGPEPAAVAAAGWAAAAIVVAAGVWWAVGVVAVAAAVEWVAAVGATPVFAQQVPAGFRWGQCSQVHEHHESQVLQRCLASGATALRQRPLKAMAAMKCSAGVGSSGSRWVSDLRQVMSDQQ